MGWWKWIGGILPLLIMAPVLGLVLYESFKDRPTRIAAIALPVVLIAILIKTRWKPTESIGRQRWAFGFLTFGLLLGLLSAWLVSTSFVAIAGLMLMVGWMLSMAGADRWPEAFSRAGLVGILLPWPLGLFPFANSFLQRGSSYLLGVILDGLQVLHLRTSRTFECVDFQFMVDDRLHGLDGLLPLLFVAAGLAVVRHRSLLHFLMLVATTLVLLITGYVSFGVIAVLAKTGFSIDIVGDWWNEHVLGGVIWILQIAVLFLNDMAFSRLLKPVFDRTMNSDNVFLPPLFNGLLHWPQSTTEEEIEEVEPATNNANQEEGVIAEEPSFEEEPKADWGGGGRRVAWKFGWLGAEVVLLAMTIAMVTGLSMQQKNAARLKLTESVLAKIPQEGSLPPAIDQLRLTGFVNEDVRDGEAITAVNRSWRYEGLAMVATLTVSYPIEEREIWEWNGEKLGWTQLSTLNSPNVRNATGNQEDAWMWMMKYGESDTQGAVYAWLCGLKDDASTVRYKAYENWGDRLVARLQLNLVTLFFKEAEIEPRIGLQFLVETSEKLDEKEQAYARQVFYSARKSVRSSLEGTNPRSGDDSK